MRAHGVALAVGGERVADNAAAFPSSARVSSGGRPGGAHLGGDGDDELGGEARRLRERRVGGARGERGADDGERAARLGARRQTSIGAAGDGAAQVLLQQQH